MPSPLRSTWIALLALALAACAKGKSAPGGPLLHVPSPAWEDQVIYMVMTDRFADGDPANDDQGKGEFDRASGDKYSGGDLKGIIDHLDYIQGLGATAVWITPPVANMWWDPLQQSGGYHGYWARDLKKVDEHLGTLATYQALSDALHRRGMYLIQDVVPNHMGNFFTWSPQYPAACTPATADAACATGPAVAGCDVTLGFVQNTAAVPTSRPAQAPFDQDDATDPVQRAAAIYHWTPAIADYGNACQEASYQISDLDDLNTENPVVRAALRDAYGYWVKEVGVDAFRVDTAKFVPHDFWNDFFWSTDAAAPGIMNVARATGRSSFLAFGEVFETPPPMSDALEQKVASYLGTPAKPELNSVLGFPLYAEIGRVLAGGQPTRYMTYRLGRLMDPALYPDPNVIPTFIDNHDVRRFLSITSPTGENLLQALAFLFTVPGIPVVYYGTEQGFTETRAAMFQGGWGSTADHYDTAGAVYQRIKKLAGIRKGSPALRRGGLEVLYDNAAGAGPFAYRRTSGAETVLVLLNTSKHPVLFGSLDTKLAPGSVLEVLHDEQGPPAPQVGQGGLLTAVMPAMGVVIARATGAVVTPPAPGATIAVTTPIAGQTFTADTTFSGTLSPATARLQMVLDGNAASATPVSVAGDGTWSVVLPVSSFATGRFDHDVAFYAPDDGVATAPARFTTDVAFNGLTYDFDDPVGDDLGPAGTYTYPQDATFHHEMDVTHVKLEVGATTLNVNLTMADFSSVWNPANGFDHVYFNLYFQLPGVAGATVMPKLNASVPAGFSWSFNQFSGGFDNVMYTSAGATADSYGSPGIAPVVKVDPNQKLVTFVYDRNNFGIATWSGVRIYVATWDYDGIGARFRPLCTAASQWEMGGGTPGAALTPCSGTGILSDDPKIMDDVSPLTIP
ncbi:MAG TPA: alpha-amylase family glycosyl hydrolase [Anaeromyxobacteraceae bacterium]|nr:alpha-amylase family glycosyl hydrolase [Anaeromyxobacteraceae bacterium]